MRRKHVGVSISASMIMRLLVVFAGVAMLPASARATTAPDWTTYAANNARTGFNPNETAITASTAANLSVKWTAMEAGDPRGISAQPVTSNGLVYWGSWDGYEHATDQSTGSDRWSTFLGQTSVPSGCNPPTVGVANTGTLASLVIRGRLRSVLLVGGGGNVGETNGQARFFALDAQSGAILWQTDLGPAPATFMWSSPAFFNGSVYVGVASFGDCPLIQGRLIKIDARTGLVQATFNVVQNGCTGGAIWSSPAIDQAAGTIYLSTGNPPSCANQPYAEALVELRLTDLSVSGFWTVPTSSRTGDGDFGATPMLFSAKAGGLVRQFVGVANKNGIYYAFLRNHLSAGPIWQTRLGRAGSCPQCGDGSIAASATDGNSVYAAGGGTTINGVSCQGSLQSLDPATGSPHWRLCFNQAGDGPVLGAVTVIPGVVLVGEGNALVLVNASSGTVINRLTSATGASFWGTPAVTNGRVYIGDMSGRLYAFGL